MKLIVVYNFQYTNSLKTDEYHEENIIVDIYDNFRYNQTTKDLEYLENEIMHLKNNEGFKHITNVTIIGWEIIDEDSNNV